MEGHRAVFDRQGALAVAGFVRVEHAAVGVEIRGIDAVRQSGGIGLGCSSRGGHGRSGLRACGRPCSGRGRPAAGQGSSQQQGSDGQGKKLFAVHRSKYLAIRFERAENCPWGEGASSRGGIPHKKCPKRSLPSGIGAHDISRSGTRSQPWCVRCRAAGCRRSRPDRRSGCPLPRMHRKP